MPLQPTPETARAIAEQYALPVTDQAGLTLAARGAMGRIWRLDTGAGANPTYAVKELLWGGDESAVRAEVAFRDAATAAGTIEAPASHRTSDGRYLCSLPVLVRVYDWADGATVTAPDSEAAGWLGRTLAALHTLRHPCPDRSPDPWYWRCPTGPDWDALLGAALPGAALPGAALHRDAAGATWAESLGAAVPRLLELTTRVSPESDPPWIYCHLDLQPSNVLIRGSVPDRRYTLLDWENAGPASPDRELAAALLSWHVDDDATRTTMDEYRRAGGPVRSLTPAAFSMPIATAVNYVYVQARASLDADLSADDRRHADEQCAGALATLPSPELLDSILAASL